MSEQQNPGCSYVSPISNQGKVDFSVFFVFVTTLTFVDRKEIPVSSFTIHENRTENYFCS